MGMGFHATAFLSRCFPPTPELPQPWGQGAAPPKTPRITPPRSASRPLRGKPGLH